MKLHFIRDFKLFSEAAANGCASAICSLFEISKVRLHCDFRLLAMLPTSCTNF